jgi:hypothetical protein
LKISLFSRTMVIRAGIAILLILSAFNYNIVSPVTDGFHEGEYLGTLWTMRMYFAGSVPFPLLVHGPMDFIPALWAGTIAGDGSIIALTRTINTLFAGLTWVLFFDAILVSLRQNEHRYAAGAVCFLLFLGMTAIIPADVVERQQAFLAIRDIFLVASLWCLVRGFSAGSAIGRYGFVIASGAAAAASLFWAYDRFLAAIAFGGGVVLVLLVKRAWKPILALLSGGLATLLILPLIAPVGTLADNASNLLYWVRHSGEVWRMSYLARVPAIPTAAAMMVLLLVFAKAWYDEKRQERDDLTLAFVAGLLALQAFFLLKYLNLPRSPNNYYFVWPFILIVSTLTIRWRASRPIDNGLRSGCSALAEIGPLKQKGLILATSCLLVIVCSNMIWASISNLRALLRLPTDAELLPAAVVNASRDPALARNGCVLLWSNEGIFATALRRPFCTDYMYPVYASHADEDKLVRQIAARPPALVIMDSKFWSMHIYDRSMHERLPAAERVLTGRYVLLPRGGYKIGVADR